jgi:hypothetical protein
MAVDTFVAYVGVYSRRSSRRGGLRAGQGLHTQVGLLDAYDAAVIARRKAGERQLRVWHPYRPLESARS